MFKNHITPCTVVITSLLVCDKPLEAPAYVKRVYSDGGASLAEMIALSAKQIEQIISRTDKKIALLSEQFGASSVE